MYDPLPEDVDTGQVIHALGRIKKTIRATPGKLNKVVLDLFQGEDRIADGVHYLHTLESKAANKLSLALNCDKVRRILEDVQGAKLVLVDGGRRRKKSAK